MGDRGNHRLPTRYIKTVVTDDRGRYLIPDLPKAKYTVWARGYGLVDSPKVAAEPGKLVDLKPAVAPDAKSAAQYYPANYWYALLEVPEKNEFPGTGPRATAFHRASKSQAQWMHLIKTDSCESCHQLGNEYTRTIPAMFSNFDPGAGMGAPRAIRTGRRDHVGRTESAWHEARHRDVRGLDHADREGRIARRKRRRGRRASSATS